MKLHHLPSDVAVLTSLPVALQALIQWVQQGLPPELILALAALGVAVSAWWASLRLSRAWRRRQMLRRFARGREGEHRAADLLRRHGFKLLATQSTGTWRMRVGGTWEEGHVRADALASRSGRLYVVEVKTGSRAPDPTSSATRRQLLEYQQVFHPDGILLADMETELLYEVAFAPGVSELHPAGGSGLRGFWVGFVAGGALCWLLTRMLVR